MALLPDPQFKKLSTKKAVAITTDWKEKTLQKISEERLAILETRVNYLSKDVAELKSDVRTILEKFNQMTGGKKALMALFAVLGFMIGSSGSLMSLFFGRH